MTNGSAICIAYDPNRYFTASVLHFKSSNEAYHDPRMDKNLSTVTLLKNNGRAKYASLSLLPMILTSGTHWGGKYSTRMGFSRLT